MWHLLASLTRLARVQGFDFYELVTNVQEEFEAPEEPESL